MQTGNQSIQIPGPSGAKTISAEQAQVLAHQIRAQIRGNSTNGLPTDTNPYHALLNEMRKMYSTQYPEAVPLPSPSEARPQQHPNQNRPPLHYSYDDPNPTRTATSAGQAGPSRPQSAPRPAQQQQGTISQAELDRRQAEVNRRQAEADLRQAEAEMQRAQQQQRTQQPQQARWTAPSVMASSSHQHPTPTNYPHTQHHPHPAPNHPHPHTNHPQPPLNHPHPPTNHPQPPLNQSHPPTNHPHAVQTSNPRPTPISQPQHAPTTHPHPTNSLAPPPPPSLTSVPALLEPIQQSLQTAFQLTGAILHRELNAQHAAFTRVLDDERARTAARAREIGQLRDALEAAARDGERLRGEADALRNRGVAADERIAGVLARNAQLKEDTEGLVRALGDAAGKERLLRGMLMEALKANVRLMTELKRTEGGGEEVGVHVVAGKMFAHFADARVSGIIRDLQDEEAARQQGARKAADTARAHEITGATLAQHTAAQQPILGNQPAPPAGALAPRPRLNSSGTRVVGSAGPSPVIEPKGPAVSARPASPQCTRPTSPPREHAAAPPVPGQRAASPAQPAAPLPQASTSALPPQNPVAQSAEPLMSPSRPRLLSPPHRIVTPPLQSPSIYAPSRLRASPISMPTADVEVIDLTEEDAVAAAVVPEPEVPTPAPAPEVEMSAPAPVIPSPVVSPPPIAPVAGPSSAGPASTARSPTPRSPAIPSSVSPPPASPRRGTLSPGPSRKRTHDNITPGEPPPPDHPNKAARGTMPRIKPEPVDIKMEDGASGLHVKVEEGVSVKAEAGAKGEPMEVDGVLLAEAEAGPGPAPAPGSRLGINHIDLLYETRGQKMFCRMCLTRREQAASPTPPMWFLLSASWAELIGHCTREHPAACAELEKYSPSAVSELRQRLRANSLLGRERRP